MVSINAAIIQARQLLASGEVVGIPTETVYGLAGNAYDEGAVRKLFRIKQRPSFDPLIVHTSCLEQAKAFITHFPIKALKLAKKFWPGPLTLLLNKKPVIPAIVTAGLPCVGVRVPHHSLTLQLLQSLSFPLAAPSANPFNYISPTTSQHVHEQLGSQVPYILEGGSCAIGIESTIVGFEQDKPVIYRLGGISVEAITQVVGPVKVASATTTGSPQTPGALACHYSPQKPFMIGEIPALLQKNRYKRVGILAFTQCYPGIEASHQVVLSPAGSLEEAAKNLFAGLRTLDQLPIDVILSAYVPPIGIGKAINDRLQRAMGTVKA